MQIRAFKEEDKQSIIKLGSTLHENYFLGDLESPNEILIAEENGKVIGFLHFLVFADYIDIVDIVVDINNRKQGIGSKLLKALENYNIKEILLEVSENNKTAINFYLKNGFTKVGIRKGYYNGIDGITMKKVII